MGARDDIARRAARRAAPAVDEDRVASLVARLGRGKSLSKRIAWPGADVEIEIQVLSQAERDEAEDAARSTLKALGAEYGAPEWVGRINLEEAKEALVRILLDPETGERIFRTAADLAKVATEDEIDALMAEYEKHRDEVNPQLGDLDGDTLDAVQEALKKKDRVSLSSTASSLRRSSLLTLVDLLSTSLMDSSSTTSRSSTEPDSEEVGP